MKLTSKRLKNLIMEVMREQKMDSSAQNLQNFFATLQSESGAATMAILTAENPPAKVASPTDPDFQNSFAQVNNGVNDQPIQWDNSQKMAELESDLNSLGLSYMQVEGEYFGPETSYLVFNISKEDAMTLGKKYLQDAIVFGQKMRATNLADYEQNFQDPDYAGRDPDSQMSQSPAGSPKIYFDFDLINLESNHFSGKDYSDQPSLPGDYHIEDSRNMILAGASVQARTDLFTQAGGKKFVIPFYSDDPTHAPMSGEDLYNVRPINPSDDPKDFNRGV